MFKDLSGNSKAIRVIINMLLTQKLQKRKKKINFLKRFTEFSIVFKDFMAIIKHLSSIFMRS